MAVIFHGLMLALPVVTFAAFSSRWKPTLTQLRTVEVLLSRPDRGVFHGSQLHALMLKGVREDNPLRLQTAVKSSVLWMLSMIFTYAIFIPNNWRRAAALIVPMALAHDGRPPSAGIFHPELYLVAIRATSFDQLSEHTLFLLLGTSRRPTAPTSSIRCGRKPMRLVF